MVDTPVCVHGWPIFDPEPCPDCLRGLAAPVTAPVTEDDIPEFLKRPVGGKVPAHDSALVSDAAKEVAPPVTDATSTYEKEDTSPGSASRRVGFPEHPDDAPMRVYLQINAETAQKNATRDRLKKAGFIE